MMPRCYPWRILWSWLDNYEDVQDTAVALLYLQIFVALVGSLGAQYAGVALADLTIALFALVAVASAYQTLGRAYAVLLTCALVLDFLWFLLFSAEIWSGRKWSSALSYWARLSIYTTYICQCIGCFFRLLSAVLWVQMYRIGTRREFFDYEASMHREREPFLHQNSVSDDVLGASIYDPEALASLLQSTQGYNLSGQQSDLDVEEGGGSTAML